MAKKSRSSGKKKSASLARAATNVVSGAQPVAQAFGGGGLAKNLGGVSSLAPKPLNPELQQQYDAASTPAQAGTPGVTAQPNLTGEQQMQDAQYWGSIAEQAAAARQRFLQQQTNTNYGIADAKKQEAQASRSQNWAAAARGIFRSSIRDNALNDIAASTTTAVNRLQDAVDAIRNENLAAYGYTFEGEQGAGDVQNAGMVKDAAGNWVPNVNTRVGKQLASYITGQNQVKAENAKAQSAPGTPAVAASGPDRQWFISALTQSLSAADRQNLRDRAVKAGFAAYKDGKGGAIVWR